MLAKDQPGRRWGQTNLESRKPKVGGPGLRHPPSDPSREARLCLWGTGDLFEDWGLASYHGCEVTRPIDYRTTERRS